MTAPAPDRANRLLLQLRSQDPRERVKALRILASAPAPSPEVSAALEAMLEDREVSIVSLPIRFGEIRYLAAQALAAARAVENRMGEVVVLEPGYPALTASDLGSVMNEVDPVLRKLSAVEQYAWLRDHGKLQGRRLEFAPQSYDPRES